MSTHSHISVDAQSSRELGDLGLDNTPLLNTPFQNNLLSPYDHSHTISNSASPSYNISSTPGDSEYSNYQPSELSDIEDPFFGVNFDDGVQRIDSGLSNIDVPVSAFNRVDLRPEIDPEFATLTSTAYPLSPIHSSSPNSPYSKALGTGIRGLAAISQQALIFDQHTEQRQDLGSLVSTHSATLQLTPDLSGSSHSSTEEIGPSSIVPTEDLAVNMAAQWNRGQQATRSNNLVQSHGYGDNPLPAPPVQGFSPAILRDEDGLWQSDETTGQTGLTPDARREISNIEILSLKESEEKRRIEGKNLDIEEWRSEAGGSEAGDEQQTHTLFNRNHFLETSSQPYYEHEDNGIDPVDDIPITENRHIEGQTYYNSKNLNITDSDKALMSLSRHWHDPPTIPEIITTTTHQQPLTSNDAMARYKEVSDAVSIASRAATWGTRRRRLSEPSLSDYDAVVDGSFLKRLSINKPREGERRSNNLFDQGLDRLANIVRIRSDSKLKRDRSGHNISETQNQPQGGHNSSGTLASLSRSGSLTKRPPSINTALAAMAGPLAAVGTTHTRNGSISGNTTSPRSPVERLSVRKALMNRGRSKSELNPHERMTQTALGGLFRAQGGPPVPNLATTSPAEVRKTEPFQAEAQDHDDDDDEDDDHVDEGDMKLESDEQSEPIIPTYEGFKTHVLRMNPGMDVHNKWLISRIAHQQEIRYKSLLEMRVKHSQALLTKSCSAGSLCLASGGIIPTDGERHDSSDQGPLRVETEFSDNDSNPGEGALTEDSFPRGVPMPPTRTLPAEFECQLCFKAKKFQKPSDWTKHVHEDVQPFTCTYERCKEPKSFKRKADWVRHENERHRHLEWWVCQVDDCRHPCYRKDNFLQHLVREHKFLEPKEKTKAAIKKARLTEPAWRMLEQCHHETTNRPQDESCKFCGKSFPTWKKLTVHLAKHMEHISLPVLPLVQKKVIDANTIISPIDNLISPVTPVGTKIESSSPFNILNVSPHMPSQFASSSFEQPPYFSATGQNYMGLSLSYQYPTGHSIYPNQFNLQQPTFNPLGQNSMNAMSHNSTYGVTRFAQSKVEHLSNFTQPMGAPFSDVMPNHTFNAHHPSSAYSMPQNLDGLTASSGYHNPNLVGISQADYQLDQLAIDPGQTFQQQMPMSGAQANANSYVQGHSPQHVPYYSQG